MEIGTIMVTRLLPQLPLIAEDRGDIRSDDDSSSHAKDCIDLWWWANLVVG